MSNGILFQVETSRVLQILTREIYDSPLALLRENVQNAYDAVRERFASSGTLNEGGRIEIVVAEGQLSITDNGIGMTEEVLRQHFWKAGASGKNSDAARKAGVVGTFGIGAMANFGVCTQLVVETRTAEATDTLRSIAHRESLKIAEECITLERIPPNRDVGTTVTVTLDIQHPINPDQAKKYLDPYVRFLPVPVTLNGLLVSGASLESKLPIGERSFKTLGSTRLNDNLLAAEYEVSADQNGQLLVGVSNIKLGGIEVDGRMILLQNGGQLMGLRSFFGLAPIPATGHYQFGGFANLSFLQPTAGREALNRESIDQVTRLVNLAEKAASEYIAQAPEADKNNAFLHWVTSHGRYDLATKLTIRVLPGEEDIELGSLQAYMGNKNSHYYTGVDRQIIATFANESSCLMQVAQAQPRRSVQLHYVRNVLRIAEVPDSARVTNVYRGLEVTIPEGSILLRVASILREDYLILDVEVFLADISHGVTVLPEKVGESLKVYIAKSSPLLPSLIEFYNQAYSLFAQFMKDFVRVHIYPRIQQFVPSSTREGVDALRKHLERNQELYRYEETERGDVEKILGEFLSGNVSFTEVLRTAHAKTRAQRQTVSQDQVGAIETVAPEVVQSPVQQTQESQIQVFEPSPPIMLYGVSSSKKKILTTSTRYPQINNFAMLLGLSDRLMQVESDFFRVPHTTRILWGGHRVIYIFTEATGRLSLYYDIELRDPIDSTKTGGGMFPTTTLIMKERIFVPVPDTLAEEFRIGEGPKEFLVRFDLLSSEPG